MDLSAITVIALVSVIVGMVIGMSLARPRL